MTQETLTSFKGLLPAIDRRRVQTPYVVEGKNFFVDIDGPVSGFGRELVTHRGINSPLFVSSFKINIQDITFFFTAGAILKYDSIANKFVPVLTFTEPSAPGRWTTAIVGGKQYFARHGLSLFCYDPVTEIWTIVTGPDVPSNIHSVTQSHGRLIVLAAGIIAWSVIDDGTNLTPSTVTGAGFQSLSIIDSTDIDDLFTVLEYAGGFLTYTSRGIIRSEATNSVNPFRHRILSRRHIPLSEFVIVPYKELEHLFVTERGFYTTSGNIPVEWQPLMSEYVRDHVINKVDLSQEGIFSLFTSFNEELIYFSMSNNSTPGIYNASFVYHEKSDQWGSFDRAHTGFVLLSRAGLNGTIFDEGYVDNEGSVWKFIGSNSDLIFPDQNTNPFIYDYHINTEFPVRQEPAITFMPSAVQIKTHDTSDMSISDIYDERFIVQEQTDLANFPAIDPDVVEGSLNELKTKTVFGCGIRQNAVGSTSANGPLDAFIRVGPIRASTKEDIDELTNLISLGVGMLDVGVGDTVVDWMLDFQTDVIVDWSTMPENIVDWGFIAVPGTEYDIKVEGTLDGYSVWEGKSETPSLVIEDGKYRQYATNMTSLNTLVKFEALKTEQNFHLKYLDLEIYPGGRLY